MTNGLSPIIYKDSKILILGSLPSKKSIEQNEYYANSTNHFWRILSNVLENEKITFENYNSKKEFLEKHNIALWDVIKCAKREGSLDKNIKDEEYNDILNLIDEYDFNKIFVNGKKAAKLFERYLKLNNRMDIEYIVLPSSSAANTRYTFERKINEWRISFK
jgi:TDG/mug DNA glycosylase family protein